MQLDLDFFFWLANSRQSLQLVTHFHSVSVWGAAICQINLEIRALFHNARCVFIIHITDVIWVAQMTTTCLQSQKSFLHWLKDSTLQSADTHTHFVLWFTHVLLELLKEMEGSGLLFPQPNHQTIQRFSRCNSPFILILIKRHLGQNGSQQAGVEIQRFKYEMALVILLLCILHL